MAAHTKEEAMKVLVTGSFWPTYDFTTNRQGPDVPTGSYDAKRTTSTKTHRPAIVLTDPTMVGVPAGELVGADEEYLRHGKATAIIVD